MKKKLLFLMFVPLISVERVLAACESEEPVKKPDSIYIDHKDGTVTDKRTGLMWQKCSLGEDYRDNTCTGYIDGFDWEETVEVVQVVNAGTGTSGYRDWRLPTISELRTLLDKACFNPTINTTLFPTTINWYWSSSLSTSTANATNIRVMNFTLGFDSNSTPGPPTYIKLVRKAQ